jgi:hypothetical protein
MKLAIWKLKRIFNTKRRVIAVLLITFYFTVSVYIFWVNSDVIKVALTSEQRSFILPFDVNLGTNYTNTDVSGSLRFQSSSEVLVNNEQVNILGEFVLKGNATDTVKQIDVSIANCFLYEKFDQWSRPEKAYLTIRNEYGSRYLIIDKVTGEVGYRIIGDVKAVWYIEGSYVPVFKFYFFNGTEAFLTSQNVFVTVNPRAQLIELQTGKISLILSFAVFAFGWVEVFNLSYYLWDYRSKKDRKLARHTQIIRRLHPYRQERHLKTNSRRKKN